ncbi:MAG: metallophosphoesterase [bacterium]|nr:metallophosphoesterase [bacterium]
MTAKSPSKLTSGDNPMEDNLVHRLLVISERMQKLPPLVVVLEITAFALMLYGLFVLRRNTTEGIVIGISFALFSLLDWFALWRLPRAGLSYGPDRPPAMALAALRAFLLLIVGIAGLSWFVALLVNITLSAVAFYATWIAPFRLGVTYQEKVTHDLPSGTKIRVLHIADLHVERLTKREHRLNAQITMLKPDVIVFSGDFVNISYKDDPYAEAAIRNLIGAWSAPLGVYCVPGTYTVEPLERVQAFVRGLDNIRLLLDEWVRLPLTGAGEFWLLGMVTTHYLDVDREKPYALIRDLPAEGRDGFRLMLTHSPDVAPEADSAGYDLYLCGHTHGGQLRLPFIGPLLTGSHVGRRFVMGRYDLQNLTLYTSRGVGMEGWGAPRARFLCPPEVILWEIKGV